MVSEKFNQPNAGPWMSWDGPWQGSKPVWRQSGRDVPDIPERLKGCDMKKPVDPSSSQRLFDEFASVIAAGGPSDEKDTHCRIMDAMDAGRISPPQAEKLLRKLFRSIDGGPGMCRIDREGNVIPMEAKDGQ
jgi:hypothetical protein